MCLDRIIRVEWIQNAGLDIPTSKQGEKIKGIIRNIHKNILKLIIEMILQHRSVFILNSRNKKKKRKKKSFFL